MISQYFTRIPSSLPVKPANLKLEHSRAFLVEVCLNLQTFCLTQLAYKCFVIVNKYKAGCAFSRLANVNFHNSPSSNLTVMKSLVWDETNCPRSTLSMTSSPYLGLFRSCKAACVSP